MSLTDYRVALVLIANECVQPTDKYTIARIQSIAHGALDARPVPAGDEHEVPSEGIVTPFDTARAEFRAASVHLSDSALASEIEAIVNDVRGEAVPAGDEQDEWRAGFAAGVRSDAARGIWADKSHCVPAGDEREAALAMLREVHAYAHPNAPAFESCETCSVIAAGVHLTGDAPSPDAPGLDAKRERVILAAFDVDGAWDAEDKDGAPILWHAEAGEVLADLRTAIEALDDDQPWYSVLRDADVPIRTVTTPDGQVYTPDCGAYHPEHPGTRCRQPEGHSGEHATARLDVTWDNAYLSAPEGK